MPRAARIAILIAVAILLFVVFTFYRAIAQHADGLPGGALVIGLLAAALVGVWWWLKRRLFPKQRPAASRTDLTAAP